MTAVPLRSDRAPIGHRSFGRCNFSGSRTRTPTVASLGHPQLSLCSSRAAAFWCVRTMLLQRRHPWTPQAPDVPRRGSQALTPSLDPACSGAGAWRSWWCVNETRSVRSGRWSGAAGFRRYWRCRASTHGCSTTSGVSGAVSARRRALRNASIHAERRVVRGAYLCG